MHVRFSSLSVREYPVERAMTKTPPRNGSTQHYSSRALHDSILERRMRDASVRSRELADYIREKKALCARYPALRGEYPDFSVRRHMHPFVSNGGVFHNPFRAWVREKLIMLR